MTEREALEQQLALMEAMCAAQERWPEVMTAVASAEDADDAEARIVALLGLTDPLGATAVLDLQVRRWTTQERRRMALWRDELRGDVGGAPPAAD